MLRNRGRLPALFLLILLTCTGCLQLTADIVITHDQDIAVTAHSGAIVDPQDPNQQEPVCNDPHFPGGESETYTDGEYRGCRYTFTLSEGQQHASGMLIERTDQIYRFGWRAPESLARDGIGASAFDDFRVSVSFPQGVLEHNGAASVHENTVTWTKAADWFAPAGLYATGNAGQQLPGALTWLAWGAGITTVLVAISIWWALARRRKEAGLEIPPPASPPAG